MTDEAKALLVQMFHEAHESRSSFVPCLHLDSGLWDCKVRASDAARTEAGKRLLLLATIGASLIPTEAVAAVSEPVVYAFGTDIGAKVDFSAQTPRAAEARIAALEGALRSIRTKAEVHEGDGRLSDIALTANAALAGAAASEAHEHKMGYLDGKTGKEVAGDGAYCIVCGALR